MEPVQSPLPEGALQRGAMSEVDVAEPRSVGVVYLARHGQTQSNVLKRYAELGSTAPQGAERGGAGRALLS